MYDSTKDLLYEVVYKDGNVQEGKIVDEVAENKLAYAANCPVTITNNDDGSEVEGTVLLCESSPSDPSTLLYTVMIMVDDDFQAHYEDGIDAKRVKYRKVKSDATNDERTKPAAVSVANDQNNDTAGKQIAALEVHTGDGTVPVPLSITCDAVVEKNDHTHKPDLTSPLTATTATPRGRGLQVDTAARPYSDDRYKSDSCRSLNNFSHASVSSRDKDGFVMVIPSWLQGERRNQRNLFCKFMHA